jgi:hypothetical protein
MKLRFMKEIATIISIHHSPRHDAGQDISTPIPTRPEKEYTMSEIIV